MINQEYLKSILKYDPDTGVFRWVDTNNLAGNMHGGYLRIDVGCDRYGAHQLAFIWMTGECPKGIDHRNGIKTCNIWTNLRAATQSQNTRNAKLRKDNQLGVKGVSKTSSMLYLAQITPEFGPVIRKTFATIEEASKFVIEQRNKCHGEFANHG